MRLGDYLVHLYEEDSSFPAGLNGRFHGLVTDPNRRTAVLFNDRYGMHRIYYHESKDALYFAAEAKAILAVCPETRRIDPDGLGEFVACGCIFENRTLCSRASTFCCLVRRWVFRDGLVRKRTGISIQRNGRTRNRWSRSLTIGNSEKFFREIFRGISRP